MAEDYGPWIEHDGGAGPDLGGVWLQAEFSGAGITTGHREITPDDPCWHWRWKPRHGWFETRLVRVCDNPAYAPIARYRIRRPRGLVVLEELLEHLPVQVAPGPLLPVERILTRERLTR